MENNNSQSSGEYPIYAELKLENQLCFPLYVCSKEVVKLYRPFLAEIDMTYTQYIAMLVLWEKNLISVKDLGTKLYLDSGTLTPVVKSLEAKGYVRRYRSTDDERVLLIELTEEGRGLQQKALNVPRRVAGCLRIEPEDAVTLYKLLYKVLDNI